MNLKFSSSTIVAALQVLRAIAMSGQWLLYWTGMEHPSSQKAPWPAHGRGYSAPCFWIWLLGKGWSRKPGEQEIEETEIWVVWSSLASLLDFRLKHGPRQSTISEAQFPQLYNNKLLQRVTVSVREQNSARHLAQTRMHRCSGPCFSWGTHTAEPVTQTRKTATWFPPSKEQHFSNVNSCHRWTLSHVLGLS